MGRFQIRSDFQNKRQLDVYAFNKSPGAIVVMWDANGIGNQQWYIGGDGTIRSALNDFCLTSKGIHDLAVLIMLLLVHRSVIYV